MLIRRVAPVSNLRKRVWHRFPTCENGCGTGFQPVKTQASSPCHTCSTGCSPARAACFAGMLSCDAHRGNRREGLCGAVECIPFGVATSVAGAWDLRLLLIGARGTTGLDDAASYDPHSRRSAPILARRANARCQGFQTLDSRPHLFSPGGRTSVFETEPVCSTPGGGCSAAREQTSGGFRSPCRARIRLSTLPGLESPGNVRAPYGRRMATTPIDRRWVPRYDPRSVSPGVTAMACPQ